MNSKIDEIKSTEKGGSSLLWQKADVCVDSKILALMAGEDVILDREFLPYDIEASKVHVEGLARIGILNAMESGAIINELMALANDFRDGKFVLDDRFEDGHSAIEARLIEKLGDVGKKVHTGRSRNDQVLVATRLWLKEQLMELEKYCIQIAQICLDRAKQNPLPMPGYTHLQRAVVSSTGMWFAGWAESFTEDAKRANQTREWIDKNPLGTAAGYGVNLPLDREFCTRKLGFARLHCSPIAAQLSRGKFEMAALEAFCTTFLDVRRLAWDLSLFSTAEFDFIILPSEFTTGSSIMPNKRNPDVVELLRGSYARVSAARNEIEQLLSLPSGYQRDLQISKGPLVRGCRFSLEMLSIVPNLLSKLEFNEQKMRAAIEPAMYLTDIAMELAIGGTPFRDAYRQAAAEITKMKSQQNSTNLKRTPEQSLAARISLGAAGNPQNELIQAELDELKGIKK